MKIDKSINSVYPEIKQIITDAHRQTYKSVNSIMIRTYWNIGKIIIEEEQKGAKRAEYGKRLINGLSQKLTEEFGKGYSPQNLWNIRQFCLTFPKLSTVRRELSWSHYKLLMRIKKEDIRNYYGREAVDQNWSVRALHRQITTHYYERLLSSQRKEEVIREAKQNTKKSKIQPKDLLKNPTILEFLNMNPDLKYLEQDLEQGLIEKLQQFLMELGKGFSFVARQQRISIETKDFYIDLVFYNYFLKCFILIDLKNGALTHQDIGQMDMYIRMYEDKKKLEGDNPTIGIILCSDKDKTMVKYSMLESSEQIFASKYLLYLPTEEELKQELEKEKDLINMEKVKNRYSKLVK